jgi:hypothetical protein
VVVWNEKNDLIMLREVTADGLFRHKAGSRERGAGWQAVANNLSSSLMSGS